MSNRKLVLLSMLALSLIAFVVWLAARNPAPLPEVSPASHELAQRVAATTVESGLEKADRSPTSERVQVATTPPAVEPATVPAPTATVLSVRVISKASRAPLAGIRISVTHGQVKSGRKVNMVGAARGSVDDWPVTDEHGLAELDVPAETLLIVDGLSEAGRAGTLSTQVAGLASGERRELVLELPTGDDMHFFGRLLAREGRAPVVAARLQVITVTSRWRPVGESSTAARGVDERPTEVKSDANGRFEISTASWKLPHLDVEALGFARAYVIPAAGHETIDSELVILLDQAATIDARVLDKGGAGIRSVKIRLETESYRLAHPDIASMRALLSLSDPYWESTTDGSGRSLMEELPPGVPLKATLSPPVGAPQQEPVPIVLQPGEVRLVGWKIGGGCELSGTVVDQTGSAVTGIMLWLRRPERGRRYPEAYDEKEVLARATTDAEGRYRMSSAPAGRAWLGAAPSRRASREAAVAPVADLLEIPEGAESLVHDLTVHRGLFITGRVIDPDGVAVTKGHVMARSGEDLGLGSQVNPRGEFGLGPLVPGTYRISAMSYDGHARSDESTASAGEGDIVLKLHAGGSLSGSVVDAKTKVPRAARIFVAPSGGEGFISLPEAHSDGQFRLPGLPAGTYDIAACTEDALVGLVRAVAVTGGTETKDVVVGVSPGARVRVRYAGKAQTGSCHALSDGVIVGLDGIECGTSRSFVVPAGRVQVRFIQLQPKREQVRELDLAIGEEREVVFNDDG